MKTLDIKSVDRAQMIDITGAVDEFIKSEGIREGTVHIFVPHTTAAVTISENADPSVAVDILKGLERIVPVSGDYLHGEGNSDAHIKSVLVGNSLTVFVDGGKLMLGTWQGIYFCEFDGPRRRKVWLRAE
ncbi:MAG: secondary thiamine-phosphate synthase enzyme YjbQ [Bacillota bacterium]